MHFGPRKNLSFRNFFKSIEFFFGCQMCLNSKNINKLFRNSEIVRKFTINQILRYKKYQIFTRFFELIERQCLNFQVKWAFSCLRLMFKMLKKTCFFSNFCHFHVHRDSFSQKILNFENEKASKAFQINRKFSANFRCSLKIES